MEVENARWGKALNKFLQILGAVLKWSVGQSLSILLGKPPQRGPLSQLKGTDLAETAC